MSMELKMLAWAAVLGLLQLGLAAFFGTQQRGLAWNAGPRDGTPLPLTGAAGRLDRALHNFLETFPIFAAAVLAAVLAQKTDATTALGAQLYFWARLAYVPAYAFGITFVRTVIWATGLVGLLMVLLPLIT